MQFLPRLAKIQIGFSRLIYPSLVPKCLVSTKLTSWIRRQVWERRSREAKSGWKHVSQNSIILQPHLVKWCGTNMRYSECGSLPKTVKQAFRFSSYTTYHKAGILCTGDILIVHVDFAKRCPFASISPNDIIPYSPSFILMFSEFPRVPEAPPWQGSREGYRKTGKI